MTPRDVALAEGKTETAAVIEKLLAVDGSQQQVVQSR
jgi:hypothetical protein